MNSSAMLKFITMAWCSGDLHVRPGATTVAANGSHARLRPNRIQGACLPGVRPARYFSINYPDFSSSYPPMEKPSK